MLGFAASLRDSLLVASAILAAAATAGCAKAPLKAPPSLSELVGKATGFDSGDVDSLLDRAESTFARWTAEEVARAGEIWKTAAAADRTRIEGIVGMARAGVWLAERLEDPQARADAAERAIQAAQWCGTIAPSDAACPYWLGAALGVRAREAPTKGLKALPLIEQSFLEAASMNPAFELGGPDRALALLYLRAPGWPAGPGDPERGLEHARRAISQAESWPPNLLALAQALAANGDERASRDAYRRAFDEASGLLSASGSGADPGAGLGAAPEGELREWIRDAGRALEPEGRR